jgi:purine-binding chemotaxis protein CheW
VEFIKGMGKRDHNFIMILDIDRVFSAGELASIHEQEKPAPESVAA